MRLGLFAVLFQAILFGWHHHDPITAGRLAAPVIESVSAALQPVADEDGCEICQVLHHLTAAPVGFAAVPPPVVAAATVVPAAAEFIASGLTLAFRARAPPLV